MNMNTLIPTKIKKCHRALAIVKILIFTFAITGATACSNDSQIKPLQLTLIENEYNKLALETKSAILNLDTILVDELSDKFDVNHLLPDKSSLLAWAVETQEPKLVSIILEKGADVKNENSNRFTPIILACKYGNVEIINALLDKGADPNSAIEDMTSAFQLCAGSTSTEVLMRMVSLGALVAAENSYGQTALMWSANYGKVANLNYLIDAGANINRQTREGYSALFFAIKSHNLEIVKAVINQGADLFAKAEDGTTAAQLGVYTKNTAFLSWFASNLKVLMGPEDLAETLTAFDRNGHQLLHAAVNANQPNLVLALLDLGANSETVSKPSKLKWRYEANFKTEDYYPPQLSPIEIAKQQGLKNIVSMLSK